MPQTGYHKTELYSLTILEVQVQGVGRTLLSLNPVEDSFLPPGFWWLAGNLWRSLAGSYITAVSALTITSCSSLFSHDHLFIRTLVILDQGLILLQYDLILANYIYNDPVSERDSILKYWGLGLQLFFCFFFFCRGDDATHNNKQVRKCEQEPKTEAIDFMQPSLRIETPSPQLSSIYETQVSKFSPYLREDITGT